MKDEMANLGERVENLLENLRMQSGEGEETGWLQKVLLMNKIPPYLTAMTDEDGTVARQ